MAKIEISNKTFQILLPKEMDSQNHIQEAIYCEDDGQNRVYCNLWDKLSVERFYKNHLKSQIYTKNFGKRKQLNRGFQTFQYN